MAARGLRFRRLALGVDGLVSGLGNEEVAGLRTFRTFLAFT